MPRTASNPHDSAYAKMLRIQAQLSMLLVAAYRDHQSDVIEHLLAAQRATTNAMERWTTPTEAEAAE